MGIPSQDQEFINNLKLDLKKIIWHIQSLYLSILIQKLLDCMMYFLSFNSQNAEITNAQNSTRVLLETVISIQPRAASGAGKSREEIITEIANSIETQTPPVYNIDSIGKQFPTDYNESMNTVLV